MNIYTAVQAYEYFTEIYGVLPYQTIIISSYLILNIINLYKDLSKQGREFILFIRKNYNTLNLIIQMLKKVSKYANFTNL